MTRPINFDCRSAADRLGPWIDGELSTDETAALETHLAGCDACRATAEAMRARDADLARAFAPRREAVDRIAAAVKAELSRAPSSPQPAVSSASLAQLGARTWPGLLLAAAAGFILAIILFPPWQRGASGPVVAVPPTIEAESGAEPVAQLVVATGDVQVLAPGAADWKTNRSHVPGADVYMEFLICPSDGVVRTGTDARCEWKTTAGGIVRLNCDSQVRFTSAGTVEVERGQIACISPENGSLKIVVPVPRTGPAACDPVTMMCRAQSTALAKVAPDGGVQVTSAAGQVALEISGTAEALGRGETARLTDGQIVKERGLDPILAVGWTGALLARKGYDDAELARHVDQLLARIGQAKVSQLYEDEIRALGEYACLPLVKYVESPKSQENRGQRHTAMRILADLAPTWIIADLVRLLSDGDPEIRFSAATALTRLTGNDQGREPKQWRDDLKACEPTIELWRAWWRQEQNRFPPPKSARPEA